MSKSADEKYLMFGEFKIIDDLKYSVFFQNTQYESELDAYCDGKYMFDNSTKKIFFNELKKHSEIKKQAGYSKLKECEYVSLVIIEKTEVEGSLNYNITSSCLISCNDNIKDSNDLGDYKNQNDDSDVSQSIIAIYHQLPNGKIVEYFIKNSYEEEIENIYYAIKQIRNYYLLSNELNKKEEVKGKKIKV